MATKLRRRTSGHREIWQAGLDRSGGFGFWGHEVARGPGADAAVRAFVNALRARGYTDAEIAEYGDWTDGRHVGDAMHDVRHSPAAMRRVVLKNSRSVEAFRNHPEYASAMARRP